MKSLIIKMHIVVSFIGKSTRQHLSDSLLSTSRLEPQMSVRIHFHIMEKHVNTIWRKYMSINVLRRKKKRNTYFSWKHVFLYIYLYGLLLLLCWCMPGKTKTRRPSKRKVDKQEDRHQCLINIDNRVIDCHKAFCYGVVSFQTGIVHLCVRNQSVEGW